MTDQQNQLVGLITRKDLTQAGKHPTSARHEHGYRPLENGDVRHNGRRSLATQVIAIFLAVHQAGMMNVQLLGKKEGRCTKLWKPSKAQGVKSWGYQDRIRLLHSKSRQLASSVCIGLQLSICQQIWAVHACHVGWFQWELQANFLANIMVWGPAILPCSKCLCGRPLLRGQL